MTDPSRSIETPPAARRLPQDLDAELWVLGVILIGGRPELMEVADVLKPGDFYDRSHELIFQAMLELDTLGSGIDVLLVANRMRENGSFSTLLARGEEGYLIDLHNRAGITTNLEDHARIIAEKAAARRVILAASKIVEAGYAVDLNASDYVDTAEQIMFEAANRKNASAFQTLGQLLPKTIRTLEVRMETGTGITGVATGYTDLDRMTAGLQAGDLIIVAARPSVGKTSLAVSIAQNAGLAEPRVPALLFSLEMGRDALVERLLAAEGRVDSIQIRGGSIDHAGWRRILNAADRLYNVPLVIEDDSSPTIVEIKAKSRRWRADRTRFPNGTDDPGLILVDYLQLVAGIARRDGNREQQISEISRGLKALAKDLRLPVVALSQLNRSPEGRADHRPQLADLRESGAIEQDADLVAFVYRDEMYDRDSPDQGIAELILQKQRNGPTGTVRLAFLKQFTRFENLAHANRFEEGG